jgi:hypothetical protein
MKTNLNVNLDPRFERLLKLAMLCFLLDVAFFLLVQLGESTNQAWLSVTGKVLFVVAFLIAIGTFLLLVPFAIYLLIKKMR